MKDQKIMSKWSTNNIRSNPTSFLSQKCFFILDGGLQSIHELIIQNQGLSYNIVVGNDISQKSQSWEPQIGIFAFSKTFQDQQHQPLIYHTEFTDLPLW